MKRFRRWVGVILVAVAATVSVVLSTASLQGDAYADETLTAEDISAIKQNILYKAVFSNLQRCYNNMAGTIEESSNNVWASFDSTTYFKSEALANNFLKFPFDVGKKNESSCPKMITGWKNNWFIDLFKGEGSYSGLLKLNTGAEVPDSSYDSSPTKMGNFLKNIGYTQKKDTTTMGDRKCFYLKFTINSSVSNDYWLPAPANGSYFETVDYCVKTDSNGNLAQSSDAIKSLIGNNEYFTSEYDNGHLTDDSNIAFIYFNTNDGFTPEFQSTDYSDGSWANWANKNYLQANLTGYIDLRYPYNSDYGTQLEATSIGVKRLNKTNQVGDGGTYCSSLGYKWCGWFDKGVFSSKVFVASLTTPGENISYSNFKNQLKSVVEHMQTEDGLYIFSNVSAVDYTPGATSYTKGPTNTKFLNYFLGNTSNFDGGKLSDAEKYVLYYTYLSESYKVATTTTAIDNGVQVSWLNGDGTFTKTYVYDPDENLNDKKYVPEINQWLNLVELNWKEIAERMAAIDVTSAFADVSVTDPILDPEVDPGTTDPSGGSNTSETPPCYEAAASLGWIVCPVLDATSHALVGIYEKIIEPFLQINASFLDQNSGDQGVYNGWKQFRDFANIIFVIIFIIVILAQLTGIGISNYNIKKILPRLIMVVVLVNISFIICQLAVDASNILGFSLQGLFEGMADKVGGIQDVSPIAGEMSSVKGFSLGGIVSTIVSGLFIAGAAGALYITWEIWLIPFLLAILGCIVGVLFFFIILGIRQAGVLILTALAPVAIVCYALPNTKTFFDKWKKMYTGLLVVYPICGILIGGGQFASALLISAGGGSNFFFDLVAMLVSVVPFFMIPSILKSSMAAMGNLGLKVANFGSRLGGGLTRAIGNSEGVKESRRSLDMHNAERTFNRIGRRGEALEKMGIKQGKRTKRIRGNAAARYNRLAFEDFRAGGRQELLKPGSSMWERETAKQFDEDVLGKQKLLEGGKMNSILDPNEVVNGNDDAKLEEELGGYLDRIIAGTGSAEEQDGYVKTAQSIVNTLSSRGTSSARARVVNSLSSAISRNEPVLTAAMGTSDTAKAARRRLGGSLGSIAGRLSASHGKLYKGDNPEAMAMLNDLAKADFSRAGSFSRIVKDRDIDGNVKGTHLRSTEYAGAGLDGMSVEDFSKLKTSGLSNILDGIQTGDIRGAKLQEAARLADEVLSSDIYTPDADARKYMEQVRDAAFASTHLATGATRSAGSSAIGSASSAAIDSIVGQLQSSGAWSSLTVDQQQHLSGLVSNIQDSLAHDSFTSGDAKQLQQALRIAHDKGVEIGGSVVSATPATPPQLKVDRNAPQPRVKAAVPSGWTESGIWVGGGGGPTRQQQIAYEEWARHSAEVDRHNSSISGGTP